MHIVILVTASSKKEARKIASALVKNKLAACVNIVGNIESVFRWQGKVEAAKEALLVIKSQKAKLQATIKLVRSLHSYDVPEVIALPIVGGYKRYLEWIDGSLRRPA